MANATTETTDAKRKKSSSLCLGRAAVCDCGTPWTFLLPFFLQQRNLGKRADTKDHVPVGRMDKIRPTVYGHWLFHYVITSSD